MKLAVVIPSFQDAQGLWFTVMACKVDLEQDFGEDEYEIIAVIDGPEDEETQIVHGLRQQSTCRVMNVDTRTPQKNRHAGLLATSAPYVFFLDSHVIVSRGFFKRMVATLKETGAALVHAPHAFWHTQFKAYAYSIDWKKHFWSSVGEAVPLYADRPYRVAISGHGAILVDRDKYLASGGYWDALHGWGGEEPQLNVKLWMMGYSVYIEPRVYHWHLMLPRRHMADVQKTPEYVRNFMLVAFASGGQKYLDAVNLFFGQENNRFSTIEEAMATPVVDPYPGLYESIPEQAAEERKLICDGPWGGDLDALRDFFRREGVPN